MILFFGNGRYERSAGSLQTKFDTNHQLISDELQAHALLKTLNRWHEQQQHARLTKQTTLSTTESTTLRTDCCLKSDTGHAMGCLRRPRKILRYRTSPS